MLIATFNASTGWVGKTITRSGDVYALEDHGTIRPADIMRYDVAGQLAWASEEMRAWVAALARDDQQGRSAAGVGRAAVAARAAGKTRRDRWLVPTVVAAGVVAVAAIVAVAALMAWASRTNEAAVAQITRDDPQADGVLVLWDKMAEALNTGQTSEAAAYYNEALPKIRQLVETSRSVSLRWAIGSTARRLGTDWLRYLNALMDYQKALYDLHDSIKAGQASTSGSTLASARAECESCQDVVDADLAELK